MIISTMSHVFSRTLGRNLEELAVLSLFIQNLSVSLLIALVTNNFPSRCDASAGLPSAELKVQPSRPLVSALLWQDEGPFESASSASAASAHHAGVGADNCCPAAA